MQKVFKNKFNIKKSAPIVLNRLYSSQFDKKEHAGKIYISQKKMNKLINRK